METLDLAKWEMQLIESALEDMFLKLDHQYDGDIRYINPATKYEMLLTKISQYRERNYTEAYRITALE